MCGSIVGRTNTAKARHTLRFTLLDREMKFLLSLSAHKLLWQLDPTESSCQKWSQAVNLKKTNIMICHGLFLILDKDYDGFFFFFLKVYCHLQWFIHSLRDPVQFVCPLNFFSTCQLSRMCPNEKEKISNALFKRFSDAVCNAQTVILMCSAPAHLIAMFHLSQTHQLKK